VAAKSDGGPPTAALNAALIEQVLLLLQLLRLSDKTYFMGIINERPFPAIA
jgi:hypothetical protein